MEQIIQLEVGTQVMLPADAPPESPWFLVYTKPRQELVAQLNLQQQAYQTYLPLFKALKKSGTGTAADKEVVFEPMFP
ncbi:MAG: transcription termination/antitermination NusG family protein, partial [Burkholderiaceae bacterium]